MDTTLARALPVALESWKTVSEARGMLLRVGTRAERRTLTFRFDVWQLRQDWVVLFLRLFGQI